MNAGGMNLVFSKNLTLLGQDSCIPNWQTRVEM